jgi:hypothetical protein
VSLVFYATPRKDDVSIIALQRIISRSERGQCYAAFYTLGTWGRRYDRRSLMVDRGVPASNTIRKKEDSSNLAINKLTHSPVQRSKRGIMGPWAIFLVR